MTLRMGLRFAWPDSSATRGDDAENFARAERHLHAAADINLPGQLRRNRIIKFLPQRDFQTDAGDHVSIARDGAQFGFELPAQLLALGVRRLARDENRLFLNAFRNARTAAESETDPSFSREIFQFT